jgi:hypothetical protein
MHMPPRRWPYYFVTLDNLYVREQSQTENRTKTPICYSICEALHFDDLRTLASFQEVLADTTFYVGFDT